MLRADKNYTTQVLQKKSNAVRACSSTRLLFQHDYDDNDDGVDDVEDDDGDKAQQI